MMNRNTTRKESREMIPLTRKQMMHTVGARGEAHSGKHEGGGDDGGGRKRLDLWSLYMKPRMGGMMGSCGFGCWACYW